MSGNYDEVYGNIGAIQLDNSNGEAVREKDLLFAEQMVEAVHKAEKFDECVELLSICKTSANPHDIMKAYDKIGEVLQPYVFGTKED